MSAGRVRPGAVPSASTMSEEALLLELRARYADVDGLMSGHSCDASTDCCRFGVTGREPYPTALELRELERAVRGRGGLPKRRRLPTAGERRCALLSDEGRCLVYAARPFGCRTFFCDRAVAPGSKKEARRLRDEVARLGREVMELSAKFAPSDHAPRPLSRWSEGHLGDRVAKTKVR